MTRKRILALVALAGLAAAALWHFTRQPEANISVLGVLPIGDEGALVFHRIVKDDDMFFRVGRVDVGEQAMKWVRDFPEYRQTIAYRSHGASVGGGNVVVRFADEVGAPVNIEAWDLQTGETRWTRELPPPTKDDYDSVWGTDDYVFVRIKSDEERVHVLERSTGKDIHVLSVETHLRPSLIGDWFASGEPNKIHREHFYSLQTWKAVTTKAPSGVGCLVDDRYYYLSGEGLSVLDLSSRQSLPVPGTEALMVDELPLIEMYALTCGYYRLQDDRLRIVFYASQQDTQGMEMRFFALDVADTPVIAWSNRIPPRSDYAPGKNLSVLGTLEPHGGRLFRYTPFLLQPSEELEMRVLDVQTGEMVERAVPHTLLHVFQQGDTTFVSDSADYTPPSHKGSLVSFNGTTGAVRGSVQMRGLSTLRTTTTANRIWLWSKVETSLSELAIVSLDHDLKVVYDWNRGLAVSEDLPFSSAIFGAGP